MNTAANVGESELISVICRTVNRPSLKDAIASVARQSWQNIELVLVDALGAGLQQSELVPAAIKLVIVSTGKQLDRAEAANAGLMAASGKYLLFLDDDDWIDDDHLSQLHALISRNPATLVVYSATQKTHPDGEPFDEPIQVPFDRTVLRRDNFIPIHAALFSRRLLDMGCRFDETLRVYEDWDFWLQCATHTDFILHRYIGAFYRMGGDSQTMLELHQQRYEPGHPMAEARALVLDKWRHVWTGKEWNELLGLIDQTPTLNDLHSQLVDLQNEYQSLQSTHIALNLQHIALNLQHAALGLQHEELDRGVKQILNSFSWKVTAPYRWAALRVRQSLTHRRQSSSPVNNLAATEQMNQNCGPLQAGIVVPTQDNQLFTDSMTVQAWAWSPQPLSRVEILLDSKVVHVVDPLPTHEEVSEAQRIGFARLLDTSKLSAGPHQLTVRVSDINGFQLQLSRQFVYQLPEQHYAQWLKSHHEQIADRQAASPFTTDLIKFFNICVLHTANDDISQSLLERSIESIKRQSHSAWKIQQLSEQDAWPLFKDDEIVVLMHAGEVLHKDCLKRIAQSWNTHTTLIYSDHDELDTHCRPHSPCFTFAWSRDLLLSRNYIGGVYFIDGNALKSLHAELSDIAWRYKILLTATHHLSDTQIGRVQEVLWSAPEPDPVELDKKLQAEAVAVRSYLSAHNIEAEVSTSGSSNCRHVRRKLTRTPLVSVIIPTTGKMQFLKPCLDTLKNSSYPAIEVIVLDNGRGKHREGIAFAQTSGAKVIECNQAFNWSLLNNIGARHSTGELLLFLNDDIEIIQQNWLENLVEHATRDDVGTVGCLLLYPNGAIQHGGVFLVDHGGGARHLFHKQLPGDGIYQELDNCVREVSASTGACLMTRRDHFEQLKGFDEKLSVVGNDIDFCLRARQLGLKNIWTPHSRLIHHESVSRQSKPIVPDEKTMWARWGSQFRAGDPFYNENLSLTREDCALAEFKYVQSKPVVTEASAVRVSTNIGVNLIAYIRASMGVGEAARGNAAALNASGIPFGIINYERGNPSRMDNLRWQHKEMAEPEYTVNLLHINADHIPSVMKHLDQDWFNKRYNIGFWAWEMPEFPDRWLGSFDLLDEIWVPSTYVNQAVAAKSPVPVITIPHVIDVDMAGAQQYSRNFFGIDDSAFVFVSLFDIHSIAQRKNPFGSILAFQQAFMAEDKSVQLVIRINNADDANLKVVRDCIGEWQNILVLDQHMDRAQIDSLIYVCDCFVSLHHAEGFGLGPAEAMGMGKAALLTDWSGNKEYMKNNNCIPVRYTLKQLGTDYGPYEAYQHWAVPDINHAAAEMRDLVANPERAHKLGQQAKLDIAREFSAAAIGERMKIRLDTIERVIDKRRLLALKSK